DPNEISGIVDPPGSAGFPNPVASDRGEQYVALLDSRRNVLPEVEAEGNGINVHEDGVVTEVSAQTVVDPSGNAGRILAPVGEEDLWHRSLPRSVFPVFTAGAWYGTPS